MEQRRLRLGDILDDYCPRERRVTNHAIVAMIEDEIKQTRCTTCDAEHVYKGGKAPRRRKATATGALYKEVLAGITDEQPMPTVVAPPEASPANEQAMDDQPEDPQPEPTLEADATPDEEAPIVDEGPVHRPLIRATLPRPDGVKVERPVPEFTIRQNGRPHGGNFRSGDSHAKSRNNGHQRFARGGHGRPASPGFGRGPGGSGQRHGSGPRKRSR
jgi:hypothetical protein